MRPHNPRTNRRVRWYPAADSRTTGSSRSSTSRRRDVVDDLSGSFLHLSLGKHLNARWHDATVTEGAILSYPPLACFRERCNITRCVPDSHLRQYFPVHERSRSPVHLSLITSPIDSLTRTFGH